MKQGKGNTGKIILKEKKFTKKKKPNKEQKIRKNKTYNNQEKPYLKNNEVCLAYRYYYLGKKIGTYEVSSRWFIHLCKGLFFTTYQTY